MPSSFLLESLRRPTPVKPGASDAGAVRDCLTVSRLAQTTAIAVGVLVLGAWLLDVERLKTGLSGTAVMKPLTALCFVLTGLSLRLLQISAHTGPKAARRRIAARTLAVLVAVVGLATLTEYALAVRLGLDTLLFPSAVAATGASYPGRMSGAAALALYLLATSLLLTDARTRAGRITSQVAAILVAFIGVVALEGYAYGAEALYQFRPYGSMAIHTASLFVLLGVGVLFARPEQGLMASLTSRYDGGALARRVLPVALAAPLCLGWLRLEGQRHGFYGTEIGTALFACANAAVFSLVVWLGARGLNHADARRREMEEELSAERERWRHVVQGIADEVWVCDTEGRMTLVNLPDGGTKDALVVQLQDGFETLTPDGVPRSDQEAPLLRALRGEVVRGEEILRHRATGRTRWRQFSAAPVRDEQGAVVGSVSVGRDVTGQREAEAALGEAHEFNRQIFESAREGIVVFDRDLRYVVWNRFMVEYTGVSFEEVRGRRPWEVFPDLHDGVTAESLRRALAGEANTRPDRLFRWPRRKDPVWLSATCTPLRDSRSEIIGVIVVLHDLTERRRADQALRESEGRFNAYMQASPLMAWMKDGEGRYVYVNRAWETGIGRRADEAIGHTPAELLPADLADMVQRRDREVLRSGQAVETTERAAGPDGSERWWHLVTFPLGGADGQPVLGGIVQDVTERKRTEAALYESDLRFRELAETIREVFWLTDPAKGAMLYVSPAYETIWGRSSRHLYESPKDWFDAIHPEDRERVVVATTTKQASGGYDEEYRILRPDGTVRWIRDKAFPVRDAAGAVTRVAGVAEDITERRQLEAQLRQTQKMESIGILAGGVAHDFNNWLTVIFGCTDILVETVAGDAESHGMVSDIRHAAEHAASLTRQLLAFSRQQVLEPKVVDLNALVSDTERMLCRLLGEDVVLTAKLDPSVSRVKVDQGHMVQVLMNLAVNARDAMPTGGRLTIETFDAILDEQYTRVHPDAPAGRYVVLAMTDTGCGMTAEVRSRVFDPFFTTKGLTKGTGLGLAVVHGIVTQSGGHIDVSSEPGVGTTFKIRLPAVDDRITAAGARAGTDARGTETILLVEDEEIVRRVARQILQRAGYTVLDTADGREALRMLSADGAAVDMLVTDVVMPEMDGRQLAEEVHRLHPRIRVLYTSGYTDDAVVRHGILQSEVAFLQKPYSMRDLLRRIREVLDGG